MTGEAPSLDARLRSATARRNRLAALIVAPSIVADARCGDADARRELDQLGEQLRDAESLVAGLEAEQAIAAR